MTGRAPSTTPATKPPGTLNPKQIAFIDRYLATLPRNASAAYREVYGVSEDVAKASASRLLRKANVAREVERREAVISRPFALSASRIRRELSTIAFSDLRHFTITEDGRLDTVPGVPKSALRAVRSVKIKRRMIPQGVDKEGNPLPPIVELEAEFRLWDKPAALRLAAQHRGMIGRVSGPGEEPLEPNAPQLPEVVEVVLVRSEDGKRASQG